MIIRELGEARNTHRQVDARGWQSIRMLLADDRMGFSFHITTVHYGARLCMHYRNHLEAVYCISGSGTLEASDSRQTHAIRAGTLYALDKHDRHVLTAQTTLTLVCVFNPPLKGREVHDETGAYPVDRETV